LLQARGGLRGTAIFRKKIEEQFGGIAGGAENRNRCFFHRLFVFSVFCLKKCCSFYLRFQKFPIACGEVFPGNADINGDPSHVAFLQKPIRPEGEVASRRRGFGALWEIMGIKIVGRWENIFKEKYLVGK